MIVEKVRERERERETREGGCMEVSAKCCLYYRESFKVIIYYEPLVYSMLLLKPRY